MGLTNEDIDVLFVLDYERLNVGIVKELGALGLREDEVGEKDETNPRVEG